MKTNLDFLNKRQSIRSFDPNDTISDDTIYQILESASKAPSSNNFQPWKVVVFKNKEIQEQLKNFSYQQQQVADASAVFLLLGDKKAYDIDKLLTFYIQNGIMDSSEGEGRKKRIEAYFSLHPEDKDKEGLRFDLGLFAMNLMYVAQAYGYDSVPRRGVDFEAIMTTFEIDPELDPILLLPIGKKLSEGFPKIRYSVEDFSTFIHK